MDELVRVSTKLRDIDDPTALLDALFAYSPIAFEVYDAHGDCIVVNRASVDLFGSAPPAGYNIFLDDVAIAQGVDGLVRRAFAGETVRLPPTWYDARDLRHVQVEKGRRVAVLTTLFPLVAASGDVTHVGICHKDVTHELELRATEEALRASEQASRLKNEFLANMSHELRTPLNAIIGFGEMLADGVIAMPGPRSDEVLAHILSSGRYLLQLIDDLLDVAKLEAGRVSFSPVACSIADLVDEAFGIALSAVAGSTPELSVHVDPDVDPAFLDPGRFKQVLLNYLSNAMKFSDGRGPVHVRVLPEGAECFRLEVEDFGIGIAPEHLSRLFTPFMQVEQTTTKRFRGTGLGLALTKHIVTAQGGHVGVTSTFGRGSTFFAVLPRCFRPDLGEARPSCRHDTLPAPVLSSALRVAGDGLHVVAACDEEPLPEGLLRGDCNRECSATEAHAPRPSP
jgi:signal transduction histidine kinase